MLTWCSSAGNICRADWLGCLFDSSSISYPLHVKGDHQWFILYTAAPCNVNAFIKKKDSYILTLWLSDKTVNQPRLCFCLEPPMIVWLEHFLFSFSAWHIQITVIKSQHGVSVRPLPPPPNTDTLLHTHFHATPFSKLHPPSPQVSCSSPQGCKMWAGAE